MEINIIAESGIPRRVSIHVDGECQKLVSCRIVSEKELAAIRIDEGFFEALKREERRGAFRYALTCLARQSLHSKQLEKKLRAHFLTEETIEAVIRSCEEKGLLDDAEWVEQKVKQWNCQGKSTTDIRLRLARCGVGREQTAGNDMAALDHLVPRKYPQLLNTHSSRNDRMKALRALYRRGFSTASVQEFLQKNGVAAMVWSYDHAD